MELVRVTRTPERSNHVQRSKSTQRSEKAEKSESFSMNPSQQVTSDEIRTRLLAMQNDPGMITESKYSPLATEYVDGQMPFVEIHLAYLKKNKLVNPAQYISNLAIMIKRR